MPTDQEVAARLVGMIKQLHLPEFPVITISPPSGPVVQLPFIVSADPQHVPPKDVELDLPGFAPVRLTVTATPHWTFDFGDGTVVHQDNPGTAYDGTDPVDNPHYYLEHTYHRLSEPLLAVTLTWTATAVRQDTGEPLDLPGEQARTATKRVIIREARAVLTG
jgi:hypothetical protein